MGFLRSPDRAKVWAMRILELATWIAAGLAVAAVAFACWQLRRARGQAGEAARYATQAKEMAVHVRNSAEQAEREAENARSQARLAWEQVKLATDQLDQARAEKRHSSAAEQWEWSYALTTSAREAVDAGNE